MDIFELLDSGVMRIASIYYSQHSSSLFFSGVVAIRSGELRTHRIQIKSTGNISSPTSFCFFGAKALVMHFATEPHAAISCSWRFPSAAWRVFSYLFSQYSHWCSQSDVPWCWTLLSGWLWFATREKLIKKCLWAFWHTHTHSLFWCDCQWVCKSTMGFF